MRWRISFVLFAAVSLCCDGCDKTSSEVLSPASARAVVGCSLWTHHQPSPFVRVTDDAYCVGDGAGITRCEATIEEIEEAAVELQSYMSNSEIWIVPESDDNARIDTAGALVRRVGFREYKVCEAFDDIWVRADGTFQYPQAADGRDHLCPMDATLVEHQNSPAGTVQRWCAFDGGERHGLFASFSQETGFPLAVGTYRGSLKHFRWLYFDERGQIQQSPYYIDGNVVPDPLDDQ